MPISRKRAQFTLRELFAVMVICALALGILLPALGISRANRQRNDCANRLRQLGIALSNYESGKRRYPAASFGFPSKSDPARDCRPGDASGGKATTGYSWAVAILPMFCKNNVYSFTFQNSQKFTITTGPFTSSITNGSNTEQHVSCVPWPEFVCPAWIGDGATNYGTTIDVGPSCGAPPGYGAPEYANIDSNAPGTGSQSFKGRVAPTNYKPMVGTHMRNGVPVGNGGMALGPVGFTEGAIADGSSKTIFLCETKECGYASWYDGTLNWLVANDPNQPAAPGSSNAPDSPPWTNGSLALNRGFNPNVSGSAPYLKRTLTANSPINDVWWGPSSDHSGRIVNHVFGDGHILGVTEECDPEVYLGLITRNGSELLDCGCEPIR
jgi:type II secretory pathway pseudopilin PulG